MMEPESPGRVPDFDDQGTSKAPTPAPGPPTRTPAPAAPETVSVTFPVAKLGISLKHGRVTKATPDARGWGVCEGDAFQAIHDADGAPQRVAGLSDRQIVRVMRRLRHRPIVMTFLRAPSAAGRAAASAPPAPAPAPTQRSDRGKPSGGCKAPLSEAAAGTGTEPRTPAPQGRARRGGRRHGRARVERRVRGRPAAVGDALHAPTTPRLPRWRPPRPRRRAGPGRRPMWGSASPSSTAGAATVSLERSASSAARRFRTAIRRRCGWASRWTNGSAATTARSRASGTFRAVRCRHLHEAQARRAGGRRARRERAPRGAAEREAEAGRVSTPVPATARPVVAAEASAPRPDPAFSTRRAGARRAAGAIPRRGRPHAGAARRRRARASIRGDPPRRGTRPSCRRAERMYRSYCPAKLNREGGAYFEAPAPVRGSWGAFDGQARGQVRASLWTRGARSASTGRRRTRRPPPERTPERRLPERTPPMQACPRVRKAVRTARVGRDAGGPAAHAPRPGTSAPPERPRRAPPPSRGRRRRREPVCGLGLGVPARGGADGPAGPSHRRRPRAGRGLARATQRDRRRRGGRSSHPHAGQDPCRPAGAPGGDAAAAILQPLLGGV